MGEPLFELIGWLPGVIFPIGTLWQFLKIVKRKTTEGVSVMTWLLFGIANIGLYIYAEKYVNAQTIIGLLGTAVLDFLIVFAIYKKRRVVSV